MCVVSLQCGEKFIQDDLVVLNPPEEELDSVRQQLEARRLRLKRSKVRDLL